MERRMLAILTACVLVGSVSTAFGADVTRSDGWVPPILAPGTDAITWTTVAASATPTGRSAIGWIGDYVYVFGNESYPNVALYWHVPSETWGNSTPCPAGASDNWTGVVIGGELYVIGRYNLSNPTDQFWKFTPDGTGAGAWTQLASYPMPISMLAAAGDDINGLVYAAGGYNGSTGTNAAYVYDVVGDNWSLIASMPAARLCNGAAFFNGKFYAVGGLEDGSYVYTNTLWEYDPGGDTWTPKAMLPQAVGFNWSSVVIAGDYIYQVGGGGGYSTWPALNYVQGYCPAGDTWFMETSLPAANGTNNAVFVGVPGDPYILSTGGWDGAGYIGQTFKGTGLVVAVAETGGRAPEPRCQRVEVFPNPFGRRGTTVQFKVQNANCKVSLKVYDLGGRLVKVLMDEALPTSVVWDGRDSMGMPVSCGVYLLTLEAGGLRSTKTVVALR